jgi:hypothetical protein
MSHIYETAYEYLCIYSQTYYLIDISIIDRIVLYIDNIKDRRMI